MGNIPLHFNCLCPIKEDDSLEDKIEKIDERNLKRIENIHTTMNNFETRVNANMNKLEGKIDRIEDKIEMKFEMLFLNMKIGVTKT